jgi:hypothetical protein
MRNPPLAPLPFAGDQIIAAGQRQCPAPSRHDGKPAHVTDVVVDRSSGRIQPLHFDHGVQAKSCSKASDNGKGRDDL